MTDTTVGKKEPATTKNAGYWEIQLPKFTFANKPVVINPFVAFTVFSFVLCTFFLGMLTNRFLISQNPSLTSAATLAAEATPSAPPAPPSTEKVDVGHLPMMGNQNAKVTLIEFGDLRCPFCKAFYTDVEPQIIKNYVDTGKVKLYFRHYDFLGPASVVAANAAECANEQGQFWAFHNYLYTNQPDESDTSIFTTDEMAKIAGSLGMNTDQFTSCLNQDKYQKNVDTDKNAGDAAQVNGTPTFFINGERLVGTLPYAQYQLLIDQQLKNAH